MQYRIAIVVLVLVSALGHAYSNPYAGQEKRPIKALSKQDIEDYRSGRGMRTSLAAELNHYPGPRHVIEHAQSLKLSPEQLAAAQQLVETMTRDAVRIGEKVVQKEAQLDALFASGQVAQPEVHAVVHDIGVLQADYRLVHLNAHVSMRQILTSQQIAAYDSLRGYEGANPHGGDHKHGMMHGKKSNE